MFSANENILLRKYKRQIVEWVEECIPDIVLDLGCNVMVMQLQCQAPGCVPLETVIVIVFPKSNKELLPGLSESKGGSFKTKILKPMSAVLKQDVLEALPNQFIGGLRSLEKIYIRARDVMLGQITQLFDDNDVEGKTLLAKYLQQSLQDYLDRNCEPPEWGNQFIPIVVGNQDVNEFEGQGLAPVECSNIKLNNASTGNIVLQRPIEENIATINPSRNNFGHSPTVKNSAVAQLNLNTQTELQPTLFTDSSIRQRQQHKASRMLSMNSSETLLKKLTAREHTRGTRLNGCPCCDPDNPSSFVDKMMML